MELSLIFFLYNSKKMFNGIVNHTAYSVRVMKAQLYFFLDSFIFLYIEDLHVVNQKFLCSKLAETNIVIKYSVFTQYFALSAH